MTQHRGGKPLTVGELVPVHPPGRAGAARPALEGSSFSVVGNWRGSGNATLSYVDDRITSSSRIVASACEYGTEWDTDRYIGAADISVLAVAPQNTVAWIRVNIDWDSPLNVCVTLIVDP